MKFHWLTLMLLTMCVTKAAAQQPAKPVEPSPVLPEYVLEVTRPEGCIVSPIDPERKDAFLIYALPRSDKVAPDRPGEPITSKVQVWAIPDGEQWRIRVSVGTGEFYDAGDHKVGDVKLNVNEHATVPGVRKFDPAELAHQLTYLQAGMNEEVEPYLIDQLVGMFPNIPADARNTFINYIRSGLHQVKTNLQTDAPHLQGISQHNDPQINQRAVEDVKTKYEHWWTRAQKLTSH